MKVTRLRPLLPLLALAVACGNITATEEGVVRLVLLLPQPAEVEAGQTIGLHAAALDANDDMLDVPVIWRALDTTIVVDSSAGLLTGRTAGRTGRVVARAGSLYATPVSFNVLGVVDTLVRVAAETLMVAAGDLESAALAVEVRGGDPPAPVTGRKIVFELVKPLFQNIEERTVELTGGVLTTAPRSSATGAPTPAIRLRRRTGFTAPAEAIVQVSVYRPGGDAVPGSGQQFVILFTP